MGCLHGWLVFETLHDLNGVIKLYGDYDGTFDIRFELI